MAHPRIYLYNSFVEPVQIGKDLKHSDLINEFPNLMPVYPYGNLCIENGRPVSAICSGEVYSHSFFGIVHKIHLDQIDILNGKGYLPGPLGKSIFVLAQSVIYQDKEAPMAWVNLININKKLVNDKKIEALCLDITPRRFTVVFANNIENKDPYIDDVDALILRGRNGAGMYFAKGAYSKPLFEKLLEICATFSYSDYKNIANWFVAMYKTIPKNIIKQNSHKDEWIELDESTLKPADDANTCFADFLDRKQHDRWNKKHVPDEYYLENVKTINDIRLEKVRKQFQNMK
jgi:hypothetical protein